MKRLHMELFPMSLSLICDGEEYRKLMHTTNEPDDYPQEGAGQAMGLESDRGGLWCVVVLGDQTGRSPVHTLSVLAHEATHVKQYLQRYIGEDLFGDETEAYLIGYVTNWLGLEYMKYAAKRNQAVAKENKNAT